MVNKLIISLAIVLVLNACATGPIQLTDQTVTAAVSFGTLEGLKLAIKEPTKRTVLANYVSVYATALRSITGNPTPDALIAALNQFIPASVRTNFPELEAIVTPVITSLYSQAWAKWGNNAAKIYLVLNAIAAGLEDGAAPYISKPPPVALNRIRTDKATLYQSDPKVGAGRGMSRSSRGTHHPSEFEDYLLAVASNF
jgi:hypothetical protein